MKSRDTEELLSRAAEATAALITGEVAKKTVNDVMVRLDNMGLNLPKFIGDPAKKMAGKIGEKIGGQVGKIVARGINNRRKINQ